MTYIFTTAGLGSRHSELADKLGRLYALRLGMLGYAGVTSLVPPAPRAFYLSIAPRLAYRSGPIGRLAVRPRADASYPKRRHNMGSGYQGNGP